MSSSTDTAPKFTPFQLSFWERCFGSTFLDHELTRMKEFTRARDAKQVKVSGYAKKIRDDYFLLLPTLYTPQISLVCVGTSGELPPDNAYVSVEGSTEWANLRQSRGREFEGERVISVKSWEAASPDYDIPRPKMGFREFKSSAFGHILNLEPIVQDLVAYQMVSCPDFEGFLGGLNVSLYDRTGRKAARMVAKNIAMIVPRDIGSPYSLDTSFGEVEMHYRFDFLQVDADKPVPLRISDVMTNRRAEGSLGELSISLSSAHYKPKTLEEPPCGLADFPTILNEDVDVVAAKVDPSLDAFKYMLYQHLTTPIVRDSASILRDLSEKLVELPQRFDLPAEELTRCKILDASYVGRPQSILRLALAAGRADGRDVVNSDDVSRAYNEYFLKNFDHVHEVWSDSDLFAQKGIPMARLSGDERKIVRLVEKYESTGRKYATLKEIAEEFKMDDYALKGFLFDLSQRKGVLVEVSQGCYRTIPNRLEPSDGIS